MARRFCASRRTLQRAVTQTAAAAPFMVCMRLAPQLPGKRRILEHLLRQVMWVGNGDIGDVAARILHRLEPRHHETAIRRQVKLLDTSDDLVSELWIEMHAVGLEQLFRSRIIALR